MADRIPVLIAAPPMRTGGTEQHLLHVLPHLARRGFDITAVLLESGGALEAPLRQEGIKVVTPSFKSPRPIRTLMQARLIHQTACATNARIIHAFLSEPYLAATFAQLMPFGASAKLVHARRSLAFYSEYHPIAQFFERQAHRLSTALVGNSQAVAKELVAEAGDMKKVCVIHNGIPIDHDISFEERARARRTFGLSPNALVMTQVANLHIYKGHADLIAALGRIAHLLPQPWRLLLPGRDQGIRGMLQAEINRLEMAENIVFTGEWKNSREPYAAADIGLLVSHTEGFSNSLIEGMAAAIPMIATRVGGNVDAIDDGETGLLVPPRDPEALSKAILQLAGNSALRRQIGNAARKKAREHFSLERCVDLYEYFWRCLSVDWPGSPSSWLIKA